MTSEMHGCGSIREYPAPPHCDYPQGHLQTKPHEDFCGPDGKGVRVIRTAGLPDGYVPPYAFARSRGRTPDEAEAFAAGYLMALTLPCSHA